MTWSNLKFSVWKSFITMATHLPSCFFIQFLEQLLKFLSNLVENVKSQRSYGFLITKELIFGFKILDLKDHFSASLKDAFFSIPASLKDAFLSILNIKNILNFIGKVNTMPVSRHAPL